MRKLLWFTIGFGAACTVGAYLLFDSTLLTLGGVCLVLGVGGCFLKNKILRVFAVILIGLSIGFSWVCGYYALYLDTARGYDGETVNVTVEIADFSYPMDFGIAADGKVTLDRKTFRIRIYTTETDALTPGDKITCNIQFRYTGAGGKQGTTYHQGNGTFLLGYCEEDIRVSKAEKIPVKYFAVQLRRRILKGLDDVFPADTLGFARALLLGDSSKLTYEEDVAFQRSGIRHVIAVSGLHITILFSLVYLFTGRRRYLTAFLGIPVLVVFAAMAGFTPSVVRACIMQGLIVLAMVVDKEYDPPTALATAALVMLIANPITITSVSFQLSVGCLMGIFLLSGRIHEFLLRGRMKELAKGKSIRARAIRWIIGSVSISVSTALATTPLSAFYFGTVSVFGFLTNLLTIWCVSFVFCGIMLACLLGMLWPIAGKAVAWVVSWAMRYVLAAAKTISAIPFAAVYTESVYIVAWLVFVYILVAVFLLVKKRPWVMTGCMLFGLLLSIFLSWLEPKLDDFRVAVLDVGQGQCILVQTGGRYYMVDCGGDTGAIAADAAVRHLLSQGVSQLDGLILTHYDKDHTNGAENLMTQIRVKNLYLPDTEAGHPTRNKLTVSRAENTHWIAHDSSINDGEMEIKLFTGRNREDGNESGLCILFQGENCDILITGDRSIAGERALLQKTALPQLELLVVGHHGSKYSTSYDLLSRTRPKTAAISVGEDNFYDMPSQETLNRLENMDIPVWRTDLQGTLIFRG